jgi:hypothetical protein
MRIPEEVLKCVAFIGIRMADGSFRARGTVFYLGDPAGNTLKYTSCVTAKHVIQKIKDGSVFKGYASW